MFEIVKRIKAVIAQRRLLLRLAFKDQVVRYRSPFPGFSLGTPVTLFYHAHLWINLLCNYEDAH